ncbi:DpnII family type II restriction endonuclease [Kribbella solani]|uniref:DpnII restriction endonuclease n=1 Tax=Kribbella solani TaxID=236067 RepID=A0A841E138_9ACTN|nr:DpnII family type II restriction endonuclease [Kribbella solani]MBB5982127.1 hypothetical protein [Kribbella solani]
MPNIPTFEEYLETLGRLTAHVDPTAATPHAAELKEAAASLEQISGITLDSLTRWAHDHPAWVPALGLAVGLSQEKLKNSLKDKFGTSSWNLLAKDQPRRLIEMMDQEFDLIRLVTVQRDKVYGFGDILVARAGTRATAVRAGASGRKVEDEIEAIAHDIGLACETRTRFVGRNNRDAPCDLVIPGAADAAIVVAAKGFDSTGSKLTDAVREIEEMADVRLPHQFVYAVIDGIGWKSRRRDLQRIHKLWESQQINGMYTLATLDQFRADVEDAAHIRRLL